MRLNLWMKLCLLLCSFFVGLEVGEEDAEPEKFEVLDVVGVEGVASLLGVAGGCWVGFASTVPSVVPLRSSFKVGGVRGFLGLLTGGAWVEGAPGWSGDSRAGGRLSTVVGSFTGTTKSGGAGVGSKGGTSLG